MRFEIRVGPALEEHGGPSDDDPDAFIATGGYGLFADCACRGAKLAIAFEPDDLKDVAAEAPVDVTASDTATVALAIQPHDDEIRIEYWLQRRAGQDVRPEEHPLRDPAFEAALSRYLAEHHDAVVAVVAERSGEMR